MLYRKYKAKYVTLDCLKDIMELGHRKPKLTIGGIFYNYKHCSGFTPREAGLVVKMLAELAATGYMDYVTNKKDRWKVKLHIRRQTVQDVSPTLAMNIYGTTDLWGDQK
jgi:hypothetical protein